MPLFSAKFLARSDTALSTSEHISTGLSRREFGLAAAAALAMPTALQAHQTPKITSKGTYDITVDRVRIDTGDFRTLMEVFFLERALKELLFELNYRPEMAIIPMEGILDLMGR